MARNEIKMNTTEEKAYNLVYEKESLGSLEFEILQFYFSICVVSTVILVVLILTEEINEFQRKIGGFVIIILCCRQYCLSYSSVCRRILCDQGRSTTI